MLTEVVEHAFLLLKDVIYTTPISAVLDSTKTFVLKCDVSSKCLGAVLMQEGNLLVFTSKNLRDHNSRINPHMRKK